MKKIFTTLALASAFAAMPALGQTVAPDAVNGYLRLNNSAFNEYLTAKGHYDLGGEIPDPTNAGSIVLIKTGKMFNFAEEMNKLQEMLDQGLITGEEYTELFFNLMNVHSWKGGFLPITHFEVQGEEFMKLASKLPEYADDAIELFLNTECDNLYEKYHGILLFLCAVSTDIIKPVDLESKETFRKWMENYLVRWREVADFGLYLHANYATPDDPEDTETPATFTGEYFVEFKTPPYVGSMEKAQIYINNLLSNNGADPDAEQLDIWSTAKEYLFREMEKDYPAESPEYKMMWTIMGPTVMNGLYIIGESEEGGLKVLQLPDAFNSQGIELTADDVARCTWRFDYVSEEQPLAVAPSIAITDNEGWFYTSLNTAFPCRILSEGMEVFTASAVSTEGVPVLEKFAGDVIPANTPVIIRSKSAEPSANCLLPLDEESTPVADNVLKGVLVPEENTMSAISLGASAEGPLFNNWFNTLPANSAYYDGEVTLMNSIAADNNRETKIYDLFGREVKNPEARGIFVINGKKVIK